MSQLDKCLKFVSIPGDKNDCTLKKSSNVLHCTALLQKCLIDVAHHYSYSSAQFDENYTSVQFVETILWLNLMKLYVFSN